MNLDAVAAPFLGPTETIPPGLSPPPLPRTNTSGFSELLLSGAMRVDASVQTAQQTSQAFALGAPLPPHQVMLALEEARLSLQFALQVRARLVEGYQELMRMQI